MTIVEIDGVYTERQDVESLYIATAQRYGVLLKTKPDASKNYAMLGSLDTLKFDDPTAIAHPNATGYLVYDDAKPLPAPPALNNFNVVDDFILVPFDRQPLLGNPQQSITLELNFQVIENQNRYREGPSACITFAIITILLTPSPEPRGTTSPTSGRRYPAWPQP